MEVYEGLISYLIQGLSREIPHSDKQLNNLLTRQLDKVITTQNEMGWEEFRHGFLSKEWTKL